jgi:hypothetical protein
MPFPASVAQTMMPICPIWLATPERLEAEKHLCHFYWDSLLEAKERAHRLRPRELRLVPDEIEAALQEVFAGIRAADTCWGNWRHSCRTPRSDVEPATAEPQI